MPVHRRRVTVHVDTSKPSISFRDFPMPERYPDYPHHTEIFEYLHDYTEAFISTRSGAWVMPKYVFGRPADQIVKTNPRISLKLQRRLAQEAVTAEPRRRNG